MAVGQAALAHRAGKYSSIARMIRAAPSRDNEQGAAACSQVQEGPHGLDVLLRTGDAAGPCAHWGGAPEGEHSLPLLSRSEAFSNAV